MMDMTMAKPKVIICGKLLLGDAIFPFLFLDSLDHEVKKQNVMYCCRLYCTIAKLVCMDRMMIYGEVLFNCVHNLRNDSGYRYTPKPALK